MNNTLDILIRIREDTKAALSSAEKNVQGFTSKANSFLNDHKQTIMEAGVAAAGLVATLGVVGKSFLDNASMIEQSRIAFETMLGSSDKARKLLTQLSDFARKTPFDLPQVIEGSQRLLAYNVAAEDIIPTFTMLGNIAAGVGKDKLPQLILAFGQVKAATHLTGAELRQFSEAGVPLLDTLAKNFKMTERFNLKFEASAFNIFNRANFILAAAGGGANNHVSFTNFGQAAATLNARNIQLGLKLSF